MAIVTIKILGSNTCTGQYILYDSSSTELDRISNVKLASWYLNDGEIYYVHLTVVGQNGDKYNLEVDGAKEDIYPTSEIILSDWRDDFWISIIA